MRNAHNEVAKYRNKGAINFCVAGNDFPFEAL